MNEVLVEFLTGIVAGPGLVVLIGMASAYAAEHIPGWAKINSSLKAVIFMGLSAGLPVLADSILSLPAIVDSPQINLAVNGFAFYIASQAQHKSNKK
jgi:hypothetical protein